MENKPIVPVSPERREKLRKANGAIILSKIDGANHFHGFVEHSFSMGWDSSYALFFYDCFDKKGNITSRGCDEAEDFAKRQRVDGKEVEVWNVHDENLPVVLDWEAWIDAQAYNPNTLSGVNNKFKARNIPFTMKE